MLFLIPLFENFYASHKKFIKPVFGSFCSELKCIFALNVINDGIR